MAVVKVSVKWGKEVFTDVEVNTGDVPLVFKSQLFALTGVPPDRQKVMIKGGLVKDDDWGKQLPKDGASFMLMGSADAQVVEAPKDLPKFVEDLPESQQAHLATKAYGSGLQNLGNTCYMNSVVQCLYAVKPLHQALDAFKPTAPDPTNRLVVAARELLKDMEAGEPFAPFEFLMALRAKFPQFAQQGQGGVYSQQDAEECWTNLLYTLKEKVKDEDSAPAIGKLFGITTVLKLKCEESGEEQQEEATNYVLKCNINSEVNHLHDGILLGLKDDREKVSTALGRSAVFKGTSTITKLPPYLTVQLVRFFYKVDTQSKAKVLRKVSFQLELDTYEYCSPELRAQLDGPRAAYKEAQDLAIEIAKKASNKKLKPSTAADATPTPMGVDPSAPAAAGSTADGAAPMDVEGAGAGTSSSSQYVGAATGKYELFGVLTHKGRSADSGHYTSWVKQKDGSWVLFDDDTLSIKRDEDILALSGGGDWHMAYLLLYRQITVPPPPSQTA